MKKKIIISGGGTLGHILPIIPVIMEIYEKYDIYYIGTVKGNERKYFEDNNLIKYFKKIYYLDMEGINRKNIVKNIKVLYKYYIIRKKIKNIYNLVKPSLVIGMGGYISGACIHIAIKKEIKTIIHEQNSVMGLANKMVYKNVNKVLLSYDIDNIKNKKVIGNPRYSYVKENYKITDQNTILIVGGSLGSDFINELILNNASKLKINDYKIKLIVGRKYYKNNESKIKEIVNYNSSITVYPFLNNLNEEMSKASLIISRSGATTISEILGLTKPSILIPSPNVTNNHQYKNAYKLYEKGCCKLIEEKNLNIDLLISEINEILLKYEYKKQMIININKYYQNDPKKDFIREVDDILC